MRTQQYIILDGVLDAYLKNHNFTDFLPVLKEVRIRVPLERLNGIFYRFLEKWLKILKSWNN